MPHAEGRWTAEHVRALPDDGNPYELIERQLLVTPAPRGLHQVAVRQLMRRLAPDARVIERWRLHDERPEIVTDSLVWRPEGEPALALDVAAYFASVWGE